MTFTISYDRPIKNLIDELSATKHVTHRSYKKTSVTLHHNGGRLSHEGVLNVWKTRPASAHFDVDSSGAVAQFVKVDEYAWAVGNTSGNRSSISIEMANKTLAPDWLVADATWSAAARLAGWLFFTEIGTRPSKSNLFYHHHWASTECAGPYMDKVYDKVLKAAQEAYDSFKESTTPQRPAPKPTAPQKATIAQVARDVISGKYGNGATRVRNLRAAGYDADAVQDEVNKVLRSKPSKPSKKKSTAEIAAEVRAGMWGNGEERKILLDKAGYNATNVQKLVNQWYAERSKPAPKKKSFKEVASEVIQGKWSNGKERVERLTKAGYDADAVQKEVNRRLLG